MISTVTFYLDIMTLYRYNIPNQKTYRGGIMTIDQHTYDTLSTAFSPVPPEAGGILGLAADCVCAFVYDFGTPEMKRGCYTPNVNFLNRVIAQWQAQGITFCGIVHSHPPGQHNLSQADLSYIEAILAHMPAQISELFFPIVVPGEGVFSYLAHRGSAVTSDIITITKEI